MEHLRFLSLGERGHRADGGWGGVAVFSGFRASITGDAAGVRRVELHRQHELYTVFRGRGVGCIWVPGGCV